MTGSNNRDDRIEELILKTEILLHGIEKAGDLVGEIPEAPEESDAEEKKTDEIASLERKLGLKTDGYVEVVVSDDEMVCRGFFYPPSEHGNLIEPDTVTHILRENGVVQGIDHDAIKESLFTCNTERVEVPGIIIARGKKPRDGIPEHYEIEQRLLQTGTAPDQKAVSVDYKEFSPFVLVKQGELLARRVPKTEGVMGSSVTGKAVAYQSEQREDVKPGENIFTEEGEARAECPGRFQFDGKTFWVNNVLELSNDVDYSTGHVSFDGDVLIHGEVKDGFHVKAGGALVCHKTLDASEVECAKDLFIKYGIIGKNKGRVKVGGKVEARFIENCYLEAQGSIKIEVGILNSQVYSLGKVETSQRGMIVGGTIYARDGVSAAQIGTPASPKTEIYCGLDFSVLRKLEWVRDKNIELAMKLKNVERGIQNHPEQRQRLTETREKIKTAAGKLAGAAKSLITYLHGNEDAQVVVMGKVFPGTFIEICNVPYIVSSMLHNVRFVLDKTHGKIAARDL